MISQPNHDANCEIQQDILSDRKFSLAELIGREGGSFLKGESPIPRLMQARTEINYFIDCHLVDSAGALQAVLKDLINGDEAQISACLGSPLTALQTILATFVNHSEQLYEFVRQVDVRWGQMYGERPHFQRPGQPPHPDDEYTHESVRAQLVALLHKLQSSSP